jgi:sugar/nucleoside kinase (ribokinase family)
MIQAATDIFLGWLRDTRGGRARDYYIRQLRDWKGSADIAGMTPAGMELWGQMCGWTLARAHARTGDRIAIASYLGTSDSFDRAVVRFSRAYADRNEKDFVALQKAVQAGRVVAEFGI